jgi:chromosome segregation ATPase
MTFQESNKWAELHGEPSNSYMHVPVTRRQLEEAEQAVEAARNRVESVAAELAEVRGKVRELEIADRNAWAELDRTEALYNELRKVPM